ncbi:hypothetical protein PLESTB_000352500 [Pleodorina starrii]|uniref:Uncharacterized protein n=1 Tax=Pleodorina starrii TaxID=330485 RepID=A0A9W6BDL2_9CHLO|nr:hypothetical protein PLESTB_000352500 [Pleodorina starrii]
MAESTVLQQLLQVHQSVEQWNRCKSDLQAGTLALTEATLRLRRCLDAWPPAATPTPQSEAGGAEAHRLGRAAPVAAPAGATCDAAETHTGGQPTAAAPSAGAVAVADGTGGADRAGALSESARARELLALACQEVAQAQYLHALALCAAGRGSSADPWVAGLGYRLRLSDQVWAACASSVGRTNVAAAAATVADAGGGGGGPSETGGGRALSIPAASPLICDQMLPEGLLQRLAAAFDPAGATPYWRQHRTRRRHQWSRRRSSGCTGGCWRRRWRRPGFRSCPRSPLRCAGRWWRSGGRTLAIRLRRTSCTSMSMRMSCAGEWRPTAWLTRCTAACSFCLRRRCRLPHAADPAKRLRLWQPRHRHPRCRI